LSFFCDSFNSIQFQCYDRVQKKKKNDNYGGDDETIGKLSRK